MKYSLLLIVLALSTACTSEYNDSISDHATHEDHAATISLNNGAKWDADDNTNKNVADMQKIAADFRDANATGMEGYKEFSNDLQSSLNTLIEECRMSGADHDALHKWLEPLLAANNFLSKTDDEETAAETVQAINEMLDNYNTYFE